MTSSIIEIILGLLIWKIVPGWISEGSPKQRNSIRLVCNVIGILFVILGVFSLLKVTSKN